MRADRTAWFTRHGYPGQESPGPDAALPAAAAVPRERRALYRQLGPPIVELSPAPADPAASARQRQSAGRWRRIAAVLVSVFIAYWFAVVVEGLLRAILSVALYRLSVRPALLAAPAVRFLDPPRARGLDLTPGEVGGGDSGALTAHLVSILVSGLTGTLAVLVESRVELLIAF